MKILILDNYDSFTYNLFQYVKELTDAEVEVFRNDKITLEAVDSYDGIILSPGPGLPKDAGIMPELIKKYAATKKIFGVCLGLQAIVEAFGGTLYNLENVYHGVASPIQILDSQDIIFRNIPNMTEVGRYHSWAADLRNFPKNLRITATDTGGVVMAVSHETYFVKGVQFHPESVMTPYGKQMLQNFLNAIGSSTKQSNAIEYIF